MNIVILSVKSVSENHKWSITAQDSTGGIMHFGLNKEYGTPKPGDKMTLHYQHGRNRVIGMDLNGTRLY